MSSPRKRLVGAVGLAVAATGLAVTPAQANPAGTGLVISEAYLNGGSAGATYTHKYVELYNPTSADIALAGKSIQYRSATGTGTANNVAALTGTIPAKGYFTVQAASNGSGGVPVPGVDQVATVINPAAGGGTLFLAEGSTALNPGTADLIDKLGYGTSNSPETGAAPTASLTTSLQRQAAGDVANQDTDDNSADFKSLATSPDAAYAPPPPPEQVTATIAEIQGTGTASPMVGKVATTRGVVTANYPTGGFNGFYIQTAGTGGDASDATPGASDGIFVYGQNVDESTLAIGDHVEVTGAVSEFSGLTQVTPAADGVTELTEAAVVPLPLRTAWFAGNTEREAHEGELVELTGPFTVTNSYNTHQYGDIGLAAGTRPLIAPTEVADAQDTAAVAAIAAENAARLVTLDDGSSRNFAGGAKDEPMSWLAPGRSVRTGAEATLKGAFVLDYRNGLYKIQPTSAVNGAGADKAEFTDTRQAAPAEVGGDVRLATFNVLNYFPTTGVEYAASGAGTCTYYNDRAGNPTTVNTCANNGPRGAANPENLERQQAKIVGAINRLGASVVSLEEIENSEKFGKDRDFALSRLVEALNTAAGQGTWAYVPTPPADQRPAVADEDVIRTAFIYKPADIALVGESRILQDEVNFDNAREPLAQAFKRKGVPDRDAFTVIVNHFKSKGSGFDDGTGQGNANPDRIGQAEALAAFAESFAADRGTDAVFLAGDFNAYTMEDPMQVLYGHGYQAVKPLNPDDESYVFGGLVGSLDHVLGNSAAMALVTGADIWDINADEPVGFEYGRYNANVTNLYAPDPYRSSDHDPEVVGLDLAETTMDVQILATNDFHGRLLNNSGGAEAGAAVMSGAVKQLRAQNPNTVFAAAGDLIGASTFESFIQNDKPTIDALNEAGLEVSAAGNHEFDAGYDDLVNRVMAPYDPETNPYGGAKWQYIAANVRKKSDHSHALPESWVKDFGDVEVGFVGGVTEDLPALVTPAGIADLEITSIVEEANATADRLRAAGADVVVLLVHEGAPGTSYASATDPNNAFGKIVHGVDGDIDAIVSGHTHLAYNHSVPVQQWVDEGRAVTHRPVVSAGQYGANLNKLVFTLDRATGEVTTKTQSILTLKTGQTANYPVDQPTKAIVDAAVAKANELGARRLGDIAAPFNRAKLANGTTENRGGESTAGNLVAEVQRWATRSTEAGAAQIAFMNPGGLRADMVGTGTGAFPRTLTYRQAAEVQPFANTLVNMRLTGAQVKTALEQQWQRDAAGNIPSRPFLRLGVSKGFTYTYDPSRPEGSRVTAMYLDGNPIDTSATYSVTVNSFLASGGDNFRVFAQGAQIRDTGKSDLQAMVDYMAAFADSQPLAVDHTQRSVGYDFPADAPASYLPGGTVAFDLSSLAFSTAADKKDSTVSVALDGNSLGEFPVDNTVGTDVFDEYGKASVKVTLPAATPEGVAVLTVTGLTTGTTTTVPVAVAKAVSTVTAVAESMTYGTDGAVEVTVQPVGQATGEVSIFDGEELLGRATLEQGVVTVTIPGTALEPGSHDLTALYEGNDQVGSGADAFTVEVAKAASTTSATASASTVKVKKGTSTLSVAVDAGDLVPTGIVEALVGGEVVDSVELSDGAATLVVGPFDATGTQTVVVRYQGDDHLEGSEQSVTIEVVKATPRMTVGRSPQVVHDKTTRPVIAAALSADGFTVDGKVTVTTAGRSWTKTLSGGKVKLTLPAYQRTGSKEVRVRYLGSSLAEAVTRTVTLKVVR